MNAEELIDRTNDFWRITQDMHADDVLSWLGLGDDCVVAIAHIWSKSAQEYGLRWTKLGRPEHFFKGFMLGYAIGRMIEIEAEAEDNGVV